MKHAGWITGLALLGAGVALAGDEPARPRRIALVVGISTYERMPELAIGSARLDASRIAAALQTGFGFDHVRLLTDASATYAGIQAIFQEQLAKEVQWRDLFMLYYVGHGLGGDFGDPRLLVYDTDPDDLDRTTLSVSDLSKWLQQWVPANRYAVLTDATWGGTLRGRALIGPAGNDWPLLGTQSFILSSSAPRQPAYQGVFAKAFLDGLGGRADTNGDLVITGGELNAWLVTTVPSLTEGRQLPTVHPRYDPTIELAELPRDLRGGAARIDKAKFVFQGGTDQRVQCGGATPVLCDSSCYVFDAPIGGCRVSLTSGGAVLHGDVNLLTRGLYTCSVEAGAVRCKSPAP